MAYKKYITRGGKTYGPYIYESRRENGHVVTDYHGKKKFIFNFSPLLFWISGAMLFLFLVFFAVMNFPSGFGMTGKAALQLSTDYKPNESINGILRLSVQKGELIPADSQVIVYIAGEESTYLLKDLISGNTAEGNFYVDNAEISGSGLGFGEVGVREEDIKVSFELELVDTEAVKEKKQEETTSMNKTSGGASEEQVTNETTGETPTETTSTEETENPTTSPSPDSALNTGETSQSRSTTTPEENSETETAIGITTEETTTAPLGVPPEGASISNEAEQRGITGGFLRGITGFFARATGFASMKIEDSVDGIATYSKSFEYKLPKDKTAKLKSGSVSVNGNSISDDYVSVEVFDDAVIVYTTYREGDTGFGKEFLDKEKINYNIDLSSLNLTAKDGVMTIKVVYNETTILETSSELSVSLEELEELTTFNESSYMDASKYTLTSEERMLLVAKAGTDIVETSKAVVRNNRLVIKYNLGKYWKESSYDYNGVLTDSLLNRIEFERKFWIKNLALKLSQNSFTEEDVSSLLESFYLNESVSAENETEEVTEEPITEAETTEPEITEEIQNETSEEFNENESWLEQIEENYSI